MNFTTQMCEDFSYSPSKNFRCPPDYLRRRHTSADDSADGWPGSSSRKTSSDSRPKSAALDKSFSYLPSSPIYQNTAYDLNYNHHFVSHNSLNSEDFEPLQPEWRAGDGFSEYHVPANTEHLSLNHSCHAEGCQRVIINVSGLKFETQLRTLERLPHTLLGNPEKRKPYWDESRQEFFLDRHRQSFQAVLYYYQSGGRLKLPEEVPLDIFVNELKFYELDPSVIDAFKRNEGCIAGQPESVGPINDLRYKIWRMLEYPESSIVARIFANLSIFFTLLSLVTFCAETLPMFKDSSCISVTVLDKKGNTINKQAPFLMDRLFLTETCCMAWFVLELGLRFICSPSKITFFRTVSSWIDMTAIVPYFVFLVLSFVTGVCNSVHQSSLLKVLRLLRVVRILKLSRHSEGLKILGRTMKTSVRELSMFMLLFSIAAVTFAGAAYYAELDQTDSQFTSILDAFWWATMSMMTIGYGDAVPKGLLGKVLGSICVLSGVLAIVLPVPIIVGNFHNYYRQSADCLGRPPPTWRDRFRQFVTGSSSQYCASCGCKQPSWSGSPGAKRPEIAITVPEGSSTPSVSF